MVEAEIKDNDATRRWATGVIQEAVHASGSCDEVWREVRNWLVNPTRRKRLVAALQKRSREAP
jgi:hypothetical protein